MRPSEHARTAGLTLTGLGLLGLACLYAQAAVWPLAAGLATGAWICADAARHVRHAAAERRHLAIAAERQARPSSVTSRAVADDIALGWAQLNEACCLTGWASRGAEHDEDCDAYRTRTADPTEPTP